MEQKIAWFTEGGWSGKIPRNHPGMRNDSAWMCVLDVTHYPIWNVQKYEKGVGHYEGWHTEQNYSRDFCNRLMVSSYYLNDVEIGGELVFPQADVKFTPKAGTFVCFPCGWPYVHCAKKPISNDKYIVTTWLQANWINSVVFK